MEQKEEPAILIHIHQGLGPELKLILEALIWEVVSLQVGVEVAGLKLEEADSQLVEVKKIKELMISLGLYPRKRKKKQKLMQSLFIPMASVLIQI